MWSLKLPFLGIALSLFYSPASSTPYKAGDLVARSEGPAEPVLPDWRPQHPCEFRRVEEIAYLEQRPGNYDVGPYFTVGLHLLQSDGWAVWRLADRQKLEDTLKQFCTFVLRPSLPLVRSDWEDGALDMTFDVLSDTACVIDALKCFAEEDETPPPTPEVCIEVN